MADWKLYNSANGQTRTLVHPSAIVGVEEMPDSTVRLLLASGHTANVRSSFLSVARDLVTAPPPPVITNILHQDATNAQPLVRGTAQPHAVVKLFDGESAVGMVTADQEGAWQIATNPLGVGMHDLTATQTDQLGLESEPSNASQVEIEAPTPPPPPEPPVEEPPPPSSPPATPPTDTVAGSGAAAEPAPAPTAEEPAPAAPQTQA